MVPLEFERPAPGTSVFGQPGLIFHHRILQARPVQPTRESNSAIEMRLRFQLPPSAVPMTISRATVTARLKAPGWAVRIGGDADGKVVPLVSQVTPIEPVRVRIEDPALLKGDGRGGVYVYLNIDVPPEGGRPATKWQIDPVRM